MEISEEQMYKSMHYLCLIRAECMVNTCDETCVKLCGVLSVTSSDLGIVMRKLKYAYTEAFEEMKTSWTDLHTKYLADGIELVELRKRIASYADDMKGREALVRQRMELKMEEMNRQFHFEQEKDNEKIRESEYQMSQMSESLRVLNGIFRSMQQDEMATKQADLQLKCTRVETELSHMASQVQQLNKIKGALAKESDRAKTLEAEVKQKNIDLSIVRSEMARRDATIANLMEKEALINAEMASLKQITDRKSDKNIEEADLETPTSVLCIKCKKGLEDISNIRAVLLVAREDGTARIECETFRILLPNLKGKRPDRELTWLRACMRSILCMKMREDVVLEGLRGEHSRFPHFAYTWYEKEVVGFGTAATNQALLAADEDRWGLYYGVRALSKDSDSEAMLFWSLLDEINHQDGVQFVLFCLSIALTMGGSMLWSQLGALLTDCGSVRLLTQEMIGQTPQFVWLSLRTAVDATKAIMKKAAVAQINATLDTIDTMKEAPPADLVDDRYDTSEIEENGKQMTKKNIVVGMAGGVVGSMRSPEDDEVRAKEKDIAGLREPTHINLFMWLRIMLRQFQEDQNMRDASIRLMFEAASVGALTPQAHSSNDRKHVEYPQFNAICTALFPTMSTSECVSLFSKCYDGGGKKVNATIFTKTADANQYFNKSPSLEALPLLTPEDYLPPLLTSVISVEPFTDKAVLTTGAGIIPQATSPVSSMMKRFQDHVATKVHALVHRKLAVLTPDLRQLSLSLPEKWRHVLKLASDRVQASLNESIVRIVRRQKLAQLEGPKADLQSDFAPNCIDGLQPYLEYKRLLVLILTARSYTENPFLPNDVFANDQKALNPKPNLCRAESLLTHLEDALYVCGGESSHLRKTFEHARLTIVARRLQTTYRVHQKKKKA
jgi:hypothetical protein